MKRLFSMMLAVMMMLALCIPAYAASDAPSAEATNDGKITITGAVEGETYSLYQMATLESFSGNAYSYKVVDEWKAFFTSELSVKYFNVGDDGYISTTNTATLGTTGREVMAKDALKYAEANNIAAVATAIADDSGTLVFENLNLGYYLIDSTLGTLCALDTTDKEIVVAEKNSSPVLVKEVQDDDSSAFGKSNDADLFQPMLFRIKVDCKKGATNYVIHDTMTNMTLVENSVKVSTTGDENAMALIDSSNYTVTVSAYENGIQSFTVAFTQAYCDTMTDATDIYVFYQAALTEDAVIAGAGNPNEAYIAYGQDQESAHDQTVTYTYEFDVVKTNNAGNYLDGASFSLWDAETDGNRIDVVLEADGSYRVAKEGETGVNIVVEGGKATRISGLDGRTNYYLQEEATPAGYNSLSTRQLVVINSASLLFEEDGNLELYSKSEKGIQIINKTGAILPETGGAGTTMFIAVGSLLVLVAGVLLVTKTRMSKMEE